MSKIRRRTIDRFVKLSALLASKANPILFAVTMGTGSISILLSAFPYGRDTKGMMIASLSFFFLNLFLFCTFLVFSSTKYITYPDRWSALTRNPVTSLYLGCFPMGATTLINVAVEVIYKHFGFGGPSFLYAIWIIWWVVVAISFACCGAGVHTMFVKQNHSFPNMTAMWLLPVVTLTVASSSGGLLGLALQSYSLRHAFITVVFSVFLVTVGITLAFMIMTVYLARLIIHGLPPGTTVLSVFLPLGPCGQAGFSIYLLGRNLHTLLPYKGAGNSIFLSSTSAPDILYIVCLSIAFVLWSIATMWVAYGLLALQSAVLKAPVAFRMSFWGLVFPNGVYANLTIALSDALDSPGLRIYGSIYAAVVICIWTSIALRTLVALKRLTDGSTIQEIKSQQDIEHSAATTVADIETPCIGI